MGRTLFVLAFSVVTIQCSILRNEEVAHSRVARSPCLDCDDWPPPPPGPPRPRYLHPYPRYLDSPPPPPPPPPSPPPPLFYYPHPAPPPPPPPPFYQRHWHKVINDSDEKDDDDGDYNDSASAVSGVIGQSSGHAFSMASAGINGGDSSKYSRYRDHYSSGSQSANKRGFLESFENQVSGSGSGAKSNPNTQAGTNIQATNIGASSPASSSAKSSSLISTGFSSGTSKGGVQSTASSNTQSSQTDSQSSAVSNAQSSLDHNIQSSSGFQAQVNDQTSLSRSTTPESGNPIDGSSGQSSGFNQQSLTNFGGSSSEGSDIQSSVFGDHSFGDSNLQSASSSGSFQSSSGIASPEETINHFGTFSGSNAKSSSFGSSSSAQSNAQYVNRQGSKTAASFNAHTSGLGDQSSIGFNVQSFKDFGGSSTESQSNRFPHQISSGSNAESSSNGDFGVQFPSSFGLTSANSYAQSSSFHHTSGKFDKLSSNKSGSSSIVSDNRFEKQSPIDSKPLYSDSINDSPSTSYTSENEVGPRPSVGLDNQASINLGGSFPESPNSQLTQQKPLGDSNSQSSNTFSGLRSGSNVQSSSTSSLSSSKHSNNFAISSSHTYHNNFGVQPNELNSQSFANSGSSVDFTPQLIGKGPKQPISYNDQSAGVHYQSDSFSHKPPSSFGGQSSTAFGDYFGSSNIQTQSNGFGDQTLGFDTHNLNNFGSSSSEKNAFQPSGPSDISKLKPDGSPRSTSGSFNNQHFESSSEISTKDSNAPSQSSNFIHKFSTISKKLSSSKGGVSFSHSNTQFVLGDQAGGINGRSTEKIGDSSSETSNAQIGDLKHQNHGGFFDESSEKLSGSSSKDFGKFRSTESIIQSPMKLDDLHSVSPKIHSSDHNDDTFAISGSQSLNSFDRPQVQRGDIPPSNDQINIPFSGPISIGNSDKSGQGREFESYEYHRGGNTGSIENVQQSSGSKKIKAGLDNSGPTQLSRLTASGLRKALAQQRDFEPKYTSSSYDSSLEKPKTDSSDNSQHSANLNGQSMNNFYKSGEFSDQKVQPPSNFGSKSSTKSAQMSSNMGPSPYAPSGSAINSSDQSSHDTQSFASNKKPKGFDINSSSTNTQTSSSFGDWSSQKTNIHSFSMGDQMCICGPQSALFTTISKSGVSNDFGSRSSVPKGESSSGIDIQTSESSLGRGAGDQSVNNQIKYKETHYSSKNDDSNVAGYDIQFGNPNIGNGDGKERIDSSELGSSYVGRNNYGLNSASNQGPSPLRNPPTPPSILLPPLGPPSKPSPAAISIEAKPTPSSVSGNIGNNDQRKEDLKSQHHEDGNTAPFTDQQQTSDFGDFGYGFSGDSSTSESDFSSTGSKEGNIAGSNNGRLSLNSVSSSSGSFASRNSRGDGFEVHDPFNGHGYPIGYRSGHFGTSLLSPPYNLGREGPQSSESGGSSYALSNAQSKNQDAFAVSVGL